MYNLFVTAKAGAWEGSGYTYDRSRFLEYTREDVAARFYELKNLQLNALVKLPCLFAYEGKEPMRVGRLTAIEPRGRFIDIQFEFDERIPQIPFQAIAPYQISLDIREWEMNRTHWAVKDEDLFAWLSAANLLPGGATPPTSERPPEPEPAEQQVGSVGAFITAVLSIGRGSREVFYRGHSNAASYRLEPSVFRKDAEGNYTYLDAEDRLYRELLVSNPGDFQGDVYTLDRLVRMQHYSLPTRLLDITSNPLIALYFACRSHGARREGGQARPEEPGEVIVLTVERDGIRYFDSDTASCLANLARLPRPQRDAIDYSLSLREFNRQAQVKRLLHFVKEEKPFFEPRMRAADLRGVVCVKGKRSNDRISFQSGAFLLFGHDAVLDERGTPQIGVRRIGISGKAEMLEQLDQLGINERTVFPYIESSARYIAQKFAFKP